MLAKTNPSVPFATSRPDHAEHPHTARLLHTSDVHVGNDSRAGEAAEWPEMSLVYLSDVVKLLREQSGDCLLITGDFFDHNRVREELCVMAGEILGRAGAPVVILPGNHDPYMANSPYVKFRSAFPDNVHIISKEEGELIVLGDAGVQVWGQAHSRYDDFAPVGMAPAWVDDVHADSGRRLWRVGVVATAITCNRISRSATATWCMTTNWKPCRRTTSASATSRCIRRSVHHRRRPGMPARRTSRVARP